MRYLFLSLWLLHCGGNDDHAQAAAAPPPDERPDASVTPPPDGAVDASVPAPDAGAAPPEIDVFLIAGQSNAVGIAARGDSPQVTEGMAYSFYDDQIVPANDPVGNAQVASMWPAFANAYVARTGHRIGFVPAAASGSALLAANDDGHGNWSPTGLAFGTAVTRARAGLAAFRARGMLPHFEGVLWAQGEADAAAINAATSTEGLYRPALRALVQRFHDTLGQGFFVMQLATNTASSDLGFAAIRRAQDAAVTPLNGSFVVARNALALVTSGLVAADGVHYTQGALNAIGAVAGDNVGSLVRGGPNRAARIPGEQDTIDNLTPLWCDERHVTFQAFVNSAASCAESEYALSLGDQSAAELQKPQGACAVAGWNPVHDYVADGDYTLQLFRGRTVDVQNGDGTLLASTTLHVGNGLGAGLALDVFVIAGQSNSVGNSNAPWRAPKTSPGFAYQYLGGSDDPSDVGAGPGCVLSGNEVLGLLSQGSAWPQFASTYSELTGRRIAFVSTGKNGSSLLHDGWNPEGPLLPRALTRVQDALVRFTASGFVPQIQGVLWVQGEADASNTSPNRQAEYAGALQGLIGRFRGGLGETLPFYVFQTGGQTDADPATAAQLEAGYVAIRAAQDSVEDLESRVQVVSRRAGTFIARGMMNDFVHYDQAGYNELGRTGAEAIVAARQIGIGTPREDTLRVVVEGVTLHVRGVTNEAASCDERSYSVRFDDGRGLDLTVPGGACAPRAFEAIHAYAPGLHVELWTGHLDDVAAGLGRRVGETTVP